MLNVESATYSSAHSQLIADICQVTTDH